jgi:flagellar biosynthesis anti-sigma factor FlgM
MLEMDLLHEAFRQRKERIEESDRTGRSKEERPSPKDRLEDSSLFEPAQKALELIEKAPDIRRDRVEEIKKKLEAGSLEFDSKLIADRLLQESILNELL